mgnify:CR=1 FL=1
MSVPEPVPFNPFNEERPDPDEYDWEEEDDED